MSWFPKSLTGLLPPDEGIRSSSSGREEEEWQTEPSSPGKSMKEDLSELGRSIWGGVASFLAPLPPPAQLGDLQGPDVLPTEELDATSQVHSLDDGCSTPGSPSQKLSGLQNDLAELKGGFAKGLSRLSSVIRVVTADDSEADDGKDEEEDGKLKALLKPLIGRVLDDEPSVVGGAEEVSRSLQAKLVSGIDEISKLASSIFPFVQEEDGMDIWEAPGLTDEVVAFARNVSKHPETWIDFPFVPDDEEQNGFEMTSNQKQHIEAIQRAAPRLAALRGELCPEHMTEGHFWKVYFVLLHSRLSEADASLLSSSQVLEAREVLLEHLREGEEVPSHDISEDVAADVVDKGAIESTVKLSPPQEQEQQEEEEERQQQQDQVEEIADEWLGTADDAPTVRRVYDEEEISFSDLEDEDGAAGPSKVQPGDDSNSSSSKNKSQGGWVQLDKKPDEGIKRHERVASSDWLTVDQEDVART